MGRPAPRGHRIFYGWYIVAGAVIATFVGVTANIFAPPVLLKPMTAELGWSRTEFFLVQPLGAVIGALLAPVVGRRVDRNNPRLLILAGSLVVGGSVIAYSQVHSLWLYLLLAGIITPAGLALCGMAVFNAIVPKWFVRKRGRAIVTAQSGSNVGGVVVTPVVVALVSLLGWRMSWAVIGLAFLALMVPVALLTRRCPEDMGLQLRHTAFLVYLTLGISVIGILPTTNVPALFLSLIVRGFATGGFATVGPMLCGLHFGRRNLGQVLGLVHLIGLPLSAAGPILSARMFDLLDNYVLIFSIFSALLVVCSVMVFLVRPPTAAATNLSARRTVSPP